MLNKNFWVVSLLAVGCYTGTDGGELEDARMLEADEIIENLQLAGFPEHEIGVLEDGTVFVGGDAIVTLEASRELAGVSEDGETNQFRQYETYNRIAANITKICINPTAGFTANATLSQALDLAITRYNEQALQFVMERNGTGCGATIVANVSGTSGGVAGFPSAGLPFDQINIGSSVGTVAVTSHVIEHELGHCIGFRHSDFYNRSISCGGGASDEGVAGVGADLIPGTPAVAVLNGSVMNSCYNGGSTGIWTPSDVIALGCLYGAGGAGCEAPTLIHGATGLTGAAGSTQQVYSFDATAYDSVRVSMSGRTGETGDADLYVRFGAQPTTAVYDCRPYVGGNDETCLFEPSQDGTYYVMINGYSAYTNVALTVQGTGGGGGAPSEICTGGADEDGDSAIDCADSDCAADPACAPGGPVELSSTDFEAGWGSFVDGGTDAARINGATYASSGTYTARIRDNTSTSVITSTTFDASAYGQLVVDFSFYAVSMDNTEDFWVQKSTNGGSTWTTVATYVAGTTFSNGVHYTTSVNVPGPFTNNTKVRFVDDASADDDQVYLDDIVITGQP